MGITQLFDYKGIKFGLAEVDNFMTEKIKKALKVWAEKVLGDEAHWDASETHQVIQKLYELSVCQKILIDEINSSSNLWKRQQAELSTVLESLTGSSKKNKIDEEEEFEVPPMMETIKNMVTEMPEPENYERLFESVNEPPVFIPKSNIETEKNLEDSKILTESEGKKNINDHFALSLSIDLNDRLAFIKHLFDGSVTDYEAVISQVLTFNSWDEVHDFIVFKVKIEHPHWKEKAAFEDRFMTILKNNFDTLEST